MGINTAPTRGTLSSWAIIIKQREEINQVNDVREKTTLDTFSLFCGVWPLQEQSDII